VTLRRLPNAITSVRLLAAPLLAVLLLRSQYQAALALVLLAGISDWLDGYAARKLQVTSGLGAVLDPLADKALLVTLFLALGVMGLVPVWMLVLAIARDLVIVTGALLLRAFRGYHRFQPSTLGKVSTFFQIVFVLLVLLNAAYPFRFLSGLKIVALALCTLFTVASGIDYVRLGIRMARARIGTGRQILQDT
jgi:cardiolipin synthase (CMP-forming)